MPGSVGSLGRVSDEQPCHGARPQEEDGISLGRQTQSLKRNRAAYMSSPEVGSRCNSDCKFCGLVLQGPGSSEPRTTGCSGASLGSDEDLSALGRRWGNAKILSTWINGQPPRRMTVPGWSPSGV